MKYKLKNLKMSPQKWSIIILISAIGLSFLSSQNEEIKPQKDPLALSTLLPKGKTLVPIELENSSQLDSILGIRGVVDLFVRVGTQKKRLIKIAHRIKILRAPKNPNYYAALVPEALAAKILKYEGPYIVSVQNPKVSGTKIESPPKRKTKKPIIIEESVL